MKITEIKVLKDRIAFFFDCGKPQEELWIRETVPTIGPQLGRQLSLLKGQWCPECGA